MKNKKWKILSKIESQNIWSKVYKEFDFQPRFETEGDVYFINQSYDLYDCSEAAYIADTNINWSVTIQNIFLKSLNKGQKKIYALTWKHNDFIYDPSIKIESQNPLSEDNTVLKNNGDIYYLPRFYPDGEYYIFIAKDFSWGYLTDPWRKHIFVFGDPLKRIFRKESSILKFNLISSN
ncbi:DUF2716 domain-containing protein [Enterococcus termitis]|uniref:DUF2716 domain-containing protein n=1 Tax=Enterococcus termitis TaxID=332950 RepID=A0A1E5GDA9_9ENTE|nr:DUF2716 domain-containing protein [Enterococcus termitis]OEG10698.1 hypothetical protein BCR25_08260 [Enterococcus termitis]